MSSRPSCSGITPSRNVSTSASVIGGVCATANKGSIRHQLNRSILWGRRFRLPTDISVISITPHPPTRTIQNPPRLSPRMLSLIDNHLPVHQHIIYPFRPERRVLKRRSILDAREIENHSIRPHPFFDRSPIREPQARGRPGCHLANGVFERNYVLLSNITGNQSRKIAKRPWMLQFSLRTRRGIHCFGVAAQAHPRKFHGSFYVAIAHHEVDCAHPCLTARHQVERRIGGIFTLFSGNRRDVLAHQTRVLFIR